MNANTLSLNTIIQRAHKIHNHKYNYSKSIYVSSVTKMIITCPYHGDFLQKPVNHISRKNGCPECGGKTTTESFIKKARLIQGNKYDYDKVQYSTDTTDIIITCPYHGDFLQKPKYHLQRSGCQKCSESHGEKQIRILLENLNINYIAQKKFENCRNKLSLPFDFYLVDYNICIEYDGIQHFTPTKFFGGNKMLDKLKINDNIKTTFCENNNIELIRIKYNENIASVINKLKLIQIKENNANISTTTTTSSTTTTTSSTTTTTRRCNTNTISIR